MGVKHSCHFIQIVIYLQHPFATYSVHISLKSAAYLFLIEPNYKFYNTELAEAALWTQTKPNNSRNIFKVNSMMHLHSFWYGFDIREWNPGANYVKYHTKWALSVAFSIYIVAICLHVSLRQPTRMGYYGIYTSRRFENNETVLIIPSWHDGFGLSNIIPRTCTAYGATWALNTCSNILRA